MEDVPQSERRTGLLVPVRSADGLVADFRRRHNALSVAKRMPPHVTVLFPFAQARAVDDELLSDLAAHFAARPSFEAKLTGVGRFDDFVWLAPEPRARFVDLIEATCRRFSQYPPYEGMFIAAEPHLTIAAVDDPSAAVAVATVAERELLPLLPFSFLVDGVSLFEEQRDGTWRETTKLPLA